MSWAIGWDSRWHRDIGYSVPGTCDHPGCGAEIDRGLAYVCGGQPYGGERGCGLFFCERHRHYPHRLPQLCDRCWPRARKPFTPTPDTAEWMRWKLTDESWQHWRSENPGEAAEIERALDSEPQP